MSDRPIVDWNRVKKLREEMGLSQTDLAVALDRSKTTIWRWESGKSLDFSTAMLQRLASALGVAPDELLAATAFGQGARPAIGIPLLPAAILTHMSREGIGHMLAHWQGEEVVADARHAGCFACRIETSGSDVDEGTTVIVDPHDVHLVEGGLYLVVDGPKLAARRYRRGMPFAVLPSAMLGRVVFRGIEERLA